MADVEQLEARYQIELEQEEDGRWIAEVPDLPGVLVYGDSEEEAVSRAQALGFRVLADRVEHDKGYVLLSVTFVALSPLGVE